MNFKTVDFKIYKIQIITFIAANCSNRFFVANTLLNEKYVMSTKDTLTTRQ